MKKTLALLAFFCCLSFSSEKHLLQSQLVDVASLTTTFSYEVRYATENNFLNEVLYECEVCLLQEEVAHALAKANIYFCELGYRIKLYDCYRPMDVQKKMWAKVPKINYVANPYGKGSIHNKGAAVDMTIETIDGCFIDMGSDYDYFGIEAHTVNTNLPKDVLANRAILFEGMKRFGFTPIRTEWWHFSYKKNSGYPIMNQPLPCK